MGKFYYQHQIFTCQEKKTKHFHKQIAVVFGIFDICNGEVEKYFPGPHFSF